MTWDPKRDTPPPTPEALAKSQATAAANREAWQARFLDALADCGIVREAARQAGVSYRHVHRARTDSAANSQKHLVAWPRGEEPLPFHEGWDLALAMARDLVEAEVRRRALGYERELVHQGRKTGETIREHSDLQLIFLMKKLDPSFRDNHTVQVNHGGRVEIESARDRLAEKLLMQIERRDAAAALMDPAAQVIDVTPLREALPAAKNEEN